MDIKKLSIDERVECSNLFYFDDGYLGSTNHGVPYYYGWSNNEKEGWENINNIKDGNDLCSLLLDKDFSCDDMEYEDQEGEEFDNWDDLFNKWFSDCNEFEVLDNGYCKFEVNKEKKYINIMVVPCIYSDWGSKKVEYDGKLIFKFNDKGELVREISEEKLNEILEDKDYYIG